jgi:hypothetical protein
MPRQLVHTTRYSPQTRCAVWLASFALVPLARPLLTITLHTTHAVRSFHNTEESSSIIWDIDCMVKGDVLIKLYHLKENKEKVGFHIADSCRVLFRSDLITFTLAAFARVPGSRQDKGRIEEEV